MKKEKDEQLKTPRLELENSRLSENLDYWLQVGKVAPKTPQAISPLLHVMRNKKDLVVAEIGVYKSWSTILMLLNWDIKKYYAVDTWSSEIYKNKDKDQSDLQREPWDRIYRNVQHRLSPFEQVQICKGTSNEYSKKVSDETLDFCFIDAGHDYESVKEDIFLWYPKVKKGGVLAGDDHHWPGVEKALREASEELGFSDTLVRVYDRYDKKIKQWYAIIE